VVQEAKMSLGQSANRITASQLVISDCCWISCPTIFEIR